MGALKAPSSDKKLPLRTATVFATVLLLTSIATAASGAPVRQVSPSTEIFLASEVGDYIGHGAITGWRSASAVVSTDRLSDQHLEVSFENELGELFDYVRVEVESAGGSLGVGTFSDATRFPFNSGTNGLSVTTTLRGCSDLEGSFTIHEFGLADNGEVNLLALDFTQSCDGGPDLYGAVRINSTTSIDYGGLAALVTPTFQELHPSACPEMSDSVYRLYTAYFGRDPDSAGWDYWSGTYSGAGANLALISQSFVESEEFGNTYGKLNDAEFVSLVYRNVLGRLPDDAGRAHWVTALGNGYARGSLMIAFSESPEYVTKTDTVAPMAGYLTWYDESVQFSCGQGDAFVQPEVLPETAYADVMVWNFSSQPTSWRLGLLTPFGEELGSATTLAAGSYAIWWNVPIHELEATAVLIDVDSNPGVWWTAVIYDHPHSEYRSPFTDNVQYGYSVSAGSLANQVDGPLTELSWGHQQASPIDRIDPERLLE